MHFSLKLHLIFLCGILWALSAFFYSNTIYNPPSHIHAWTQSDRYAIALQYQQNGFQFFKPQTFNLATKEGVTAVDLPINEYVVAVLMQIFGTNNPIIFRLYMLISSCIGILFLFRLMYLHSQSYFKSWLIALLAFSMPIVVYYQAGFIPSATALSFSYIAYYYYYLYYHKPKEKYFFIALSCIAIASMIRMPFHIYLLALLLQQILVWIQQKKVNKTELTAIAVAYTATILWLIYKNYLTKTYGSQFLTELMPATSFAEVKNILKQVKERWTYQLFTIYHYLFFCFALVALLANKKSKKDYFILLHLAILSIGFIIYFALMQRQFIHHEYYFIDSFYAQAVFFIGLSISLIKNKSVFLRLGFSVLSIALLYGAIKDAKGIQELKYATTTWDRGEITRKNFIGSAQYLDSLGIAQNAKILVIDAYSTNAPLIQMNRKGYTVLSTTFQNIEKALKLNFDYIATQDIYYESDIVANYPKINQQIEKIAGNGRISIYQLKKKP